jgi:lipid-binding SYLF domain-containing protein
MGRTEIGGRILSPALIALGLSVLVAGSWACAPQQADVGQASAEGAATVTERSDRAQEEAGETEEWPGRQPRADVLQTIANYKQADPGISKFFENSAGYVVFPGIGKGGAGIGGAHGNGEVIARGVGAIGRASMTQITVGLQIGGQEYSEIIFFEDPVDLERFTKGGLELAAQVSAVAITAGAADGANYKDGVAVFTRTKSGMMGEASVGGQKFNYEPY